MLNFFSTFRKSVAKRLFLFPTHILCNSPDLLGDEPCAGVGMLCYDRGQIAKRSVMEEGKKPSWSKSNDKQPNGGYSS
jgi:hypothetical protein